MQNILVPTDFSECAEEALASAALFAEQFDANIHLIHIVTKPQQQRRPIMQEAQLGSQRFNEVQRAMAALQELAEQYPKLNIQCQVLQGPLVQMIDEYSSEQAIDLVIMGSHGIGGKQEFFIGSNTQKVVRQVHLKTLVVKNRLKDLELQHVVFASNFDDRDKASLLRFKKFVAPFAPKVHLVYINTDPFFGLPYTIIKDVMKEAEKLFAPLEVESHYLRDLSVDKGVRHIAKNIQADLIGISNHLKHPLKRIFSGSNVEALVNHSEVPVLSLDYA